jgi:hypothetical protein
MVMFAAARTDRKYSHHALKSPAVRKKNRDKIFMERVPAPPV